MLRRNSQAGDAFTGFAIVLFALLFLVLIIGSLTQRVTEDRAQNRFEELAEGQSVVIVRHSNNWPVFGHPRDVTFELEVGNDRTPMSGRCQDDWFSPMICRLYGSGGE